MVVGRDDQGVYRMQGHAVMCGGDDVSFVFDAVVLLERRTTMPPVARQGKCILIRRAGAAAAVVADRDRLILFASCTAYSYSIAAQLTVNVKMCELLCS